MCRNDCVRLIKWFGDHSSLVLFDGNYVKMYENSHHLNH